MLVENYRKKLSKSILLFSSNHEGEQIAAINAANRTLQSAKMSWHDVVDALNGNSSDCQALDAGLEAGLSRGYDAGYADGYRRGRSDFERKLSYKDKLRELQKRERYLNEWSQSFVENCMNFAELTDKQKRVIDRLYRQFCE